MPICSHECLDGFGILHSKLLEYILNVLSLVDEGVSHPGFRDPGVDIITGCARTKSHTYDDSWYRNECHIIYI
jgi:hypothetical protein